MLLSLTEAGLGRGVVQGEGWEVRRIEVRRLQPLRWVAEAVDLEAGRRRQLQPLLQRPLEAALLEAGRKAAPVAAQQLVLQEHPLLPLPVSGSATGPMSAAAG